MTNLKRIESYGIDIDFIGRVSALEFIGGLRDRDDLEEKYNELSCSEKAFLSEQDKRLLTKVKEAYEDLLTIGNIASDKPLNYWWNHLEKIVRGDLIVTIDDSSTSVHLKQQKNIM